MKKVLMIIAAVSMILLVGMAKPAKHELNEEQTAAIQKAVLKSHQEMINAMENLDVDKFFESIIDSGKGTIVQDGNVMTRKESLDSVKKGFEGVTKLKYEFFHKTVKVLSPETAILIGKGRTTITIHTGEIFNTNFAVSSVFVMKDGKWKIIHGHHSIPNPR